MLELGPTTPFSTSSSSSKKPYLPLFSSLEVVTFFFEIEISHTIDFTSFFIATPSCLQQLKFIKSGLT